MLCIALLYLQHNTILLTYLQYIPLLLLSLLLLLLFLMLLLSYKRHLQYIKNLFTILGITLKVKYDHRSKFSNLSNWKEEA